MSRNTHRSLSAVEPDDIALSRRLTRLRRRVRTILLARHLVVAMSLAATVGSVAVSWPIAIPAVAWAASMIVAVVSAVAWALLRTPRVREIAGLVDGRLRLADRVVTALALHGSRDPIARLIVRDTIARMTDERMASVFPFELGRPVMSAVGAAVVCVVVLAGVSRWPQAPVSSAGGGTRIASGGGQAQPSQRTSRAAEGSAVQPGSDTPAAQSVPASAPVETDATTQMADAAGRGIADSQSERSSGAATRSDGDRPLGSRGERPLPSQGSPDLSRAPSSGSGASGTSVSTGGSAASRPDARQTGAAPRAQAARAGGAGEGTSDEDKGSGGIQQGALRAAAAPAAVPSAANYSVAYRTARTRVDTAIAREEIPRSRRAYVRDYFLAIAPRD